MAGRACKALGACGDTMMEWNQFWKIKCLAKFAENDRLDKNKHGDQQSLQKVFKALLEGLSMDEHVKSNGQAPEIYDLLTRAVESECSDPRDRIYGLLGMTSVSVAEAAQNFKDGVKGLTVDYTRSTLDVYIDLMEQLITHDQSLEVVYRDTKPTTFAADLELPSWAIDWSAPTAPSTWTQMLPLWKACRTRLDVGPEYLNGRKAIQRRSDRRILGLRGYAVGIVVGNITETRCRKLRLWNSKLAFERPFGSDQESLDSEIDSVDTESIQTGTWERHIVFNGQVSQRPPAWKVSKKKDPRRSCHCIKVPAETAIGFHGSRRGDRKLRNS